jgi:hypothetical protein
MSKKELSKKKQKNDIFGVVGSSSTHWRCKVCTAFSTDTASEISKDIIFKRRTYREIIDHYNPMRKQGETPLSLTNLNSHKQHCQPEIVAKQAWDKMINISKDPLIQVYNDKYHTEFDRLAAINAIYHERVKNLVYIDRILESRKASLASMHNGCSLRASASGSAVDDEIFHTENSVVYLVSQLSNLQARLHADLVSHMRLDKEANKEDVNIHISIINDLPDFLKSVTSELKPVLEDPVLFGRVIDTIASSLDKYFGRYLAQTQQYDEAEEVAQPNIG